MNRCLIFLMGLCAQLACGCSEYEEPEPNPIQFILRVADGGQAIWVDAIGGSSTNGRWRRINPEDPELFQTSASCHCDHCDGYGDCPMYDAMQPQVDEVRPGGRYSDEWNGLVPGPTRDCEGGTTQCYQWEAAPNGEYIVRFCYGLGIDGTPPHDASLQDEHCEEVAFQIPEDDGVVEYIVE